MKSSKYSRPILSTIFDFIGALVFFLGVVSIVVGFRSGTSFAWSFFTSGAACILAAFIYFGIAQVVDFLARSAYFTEENYLQLTKIVSALPMFEQAAKAMVAPRTNGTKSRSRYYYSNGGNQEG